MDIDPTVLHPRTPVDEEEEALLHWDADDPARMPALPPSFDHFAALQRFDALASSYQVHRTSPPRTNSTRQPLYACAQEVSTQTDPVRRDTGSNTINVVDRGMENSNLQPIRSATPSRWPAIRRVSAEHIPSRLRSAVGHATYDAWTTMLTTSDRIVPLTAGMLRYATQAAAIRSVELGPISAEAKNLLRDAAIDTASVNLDEIETLCNQWQQLSTVQ